MIVCHIFTRNIRCKRSLHLAGPWMQLPNTFHYSETYIQLITSIAVTELLTQLPNTVYSCCRYGVVAVSTERTGGGHNFFKNIYSAGSTSTVSVTVHDF